MTSFTVGANLFLVFLAAGNAIECEVCSDRSSMDCSGELVTCDQTVESCSTTMSEYNLEGMNPIYNVFKNCSGVEAENTLYMGAVKGGFYQLRVEVCQTNGCNKEPLQFPPKNTTLNGVKCPTCEVDGDLSCGATEVLECFGEMTNCMYVAGTFRVSDAPPVQSAFRGCTSAESAEMFPVGLEDENIVTLIISKGV
ncbi:phospholipase A2 inhibitor and Ly6/PLAUR domain-containing protein-like [Pleurodeles waltl]